MPESYDQFGTHLRLGKQSQKTTPDIIIQVPVYPVQRLMTVAVILVGNPIGLLVKNCAGQW